MSHFEVLILDDPAADPLSPEAQARILDWLHDVLDKQRERRSVGRPDRGYLSVGRLQPAPCPGCLGRGWVLDYSTPSPHLAPHLPCPRCRP